MGEDWIWRWGRAFLSTGERGDEARIGDDESGEETLGRWSHGPAKIVVGANESMVVFGGGEEERRLVSRMCVGGGGGLGERVSVEVEKVSIE